MYMRRSKQSADATEVFLCPKCETVLYIWTDGTEQWEDGNELLVAKYAKPGETGDTGNTKHVV